MPSIPHKAMPKNFDFREAEHRLYQHWLEHGWFKPEVADADPSPLSQERAMRSPLR